MWNGKQQTEKACHFHCVLFMFMAGKLENSMGKSKGGGWAKFIYIWFYFTNWIFVHKKSNTRDNDKKRLLSMVKRQGFNYVEESCLEKDKKVLIKFTIEHEKFEGVRGWWQIVGSTCRVFFFPFTLSILFPLPQSFFSSAEKEQREQKIGTRQKKLKLSHAEEDYSHFHNYTQSCVQLYHGRVIFSMQGEKIIPTWHHTLTFFYIAP